MSKKTSFVFALLAAAGLGAVATQTAQAGVIWYTDRAAWTAAAGSPTFSEDFESFPFDILFRAAPVALNGMSIQEESSLFFAFRNLVDVPPFVFTDNGGTTHASMYTNFGETSVRITFAAANAAFGGESWLSPGGEGAQLSIYDGATLLDSRELAANAGAFLGYVLTGGVTATSVRFTSVTDQPGPSGTGFGYDNLAGVVAGSGPTPVPVPGPGTAGLLALGLGAVWSARRRRA